MAQQVKKKNRLRLIGIMMLMSSLLLLIICSLWLQSQYKNEKANLTIKLNAILDKSFEQVLDSIVQFNLAIIPHNYQTKHATGSQSISYYSSSAFTATGINPDSEDMKNLMHESRPMPNPEGFSQDNNIIDTTLLQEVSKSFKKAVFVITDTFATSSYKPEVFLSYFKKDVGKLYPFSIHIANKQDSTNNNIIIKRDAIHFGVSEYHTFLFKQITPQITFSVFMLLFTTGAFWLAYRTLRQQILLSAQKDNFISNVSHELKTPVTTTKIALEALTNFNAIDDPVKTKDYLQMATWEINRLEQMVGKVLNNMQLEEGKITMHTEQINLSILLTELVASMNPLFIQEKKHLNIVSGFEKIILLGDKIHLQGVFYNILDNALKYGGSNVTVHLAKQESSAIITISDNGKGIPEAYKQKIFDKFFRIPTGDIHNVKGYGLGLNYVRFIVDSHNGTIEQYNQTQGGAAFKISLPLLP